MKIELRLLIEGSKAACSVKIIQINQSHFDNNGTVLTIGSSWGDITKMIESKILESQERFDEARSVRSS